MPWPILSQPSSDLFSNDCRQPLPSQSWLGRPTYRLTLPAATRPTAASPIARSAILSAKWKTPSCTASQSRTSSTISLTSHSLPDQLGFRSKTIVPTFVESTPILIKALARQRDILIFVMLSAISAASSLLETEFLWSNTLNHLLPLLKPSSSPDPSWKAS